MADRFDFFFKQPVTQAELDGSNDKLEVADQRIVSEAVGFGFLISGPEPATVVENTVPDLQVKSNAFLAYDPLGRRISNALSGFLGGVDIGLPPQLVNMAVDEVGAGTAVVGGGNEKTLAIFIEFERKLTDPRTDGNSATVFFNRAESIKFNVVQSPEAAVGLSVPPPLRPDQILLADVTIIFGQTAILNADVDQSRRQAFALNALHGGSHVEGGTDPVPNATPSVGGLHSAVDKTAWDATPKTVTEHSNLFSNRIGRFRPAAAVAPSAITLDITGLMAGKAAGGSAVKEGIVTQNQAPQNRVELRDQNFDHHKDATGNRVFGEVTVDNETTPTVWTLSFFSFIAGVKTAFDMTPFSGNNVHAWMRESFTLENEPTFEALEDENLEAGTIPTASTTVQGKALAGTSSPAVPLVGTINVIENGGVPIAGGPFHKVNFSAGAVAGAPGEVNVTVGSGPTGPAGPTGPQGSQGIQGPTGPGFSQEGPFKFSTSHAGGTSGTDVFTFAFTVKMYMVCISTIDSVGGLSAQHRITSASKSGTQVSVGFNTPAPGAGIAMIIGCTASG